MSSSSGAAGAGGAVCPARTGRLVGQLDAQDEAQLAAHPSLVPQASTIGVGVRVMVVFSSQPSECGTSTVSVVRGAVAEGIAVLLEESAARWARAGESAGPPLRAAVKGAAHNAGTACWG